MFALPTQTLALWINSGSRRQLAAQAEYQPAHSSHMHATFALSSHSLRGKKRSRCKWKPGSRYRRDVCRDLYMYILLDARLAPSSSVPEESTKPLTAALSRCVDDKKLLCVALCMCVCVCPICARSTQWESCWAAPLNLRDALNCFSPTLRRNNQWKMRGVMQLT